MEHLHAIPYIREIMIILIAAGILVPLFNRFKLSPVLGYLAVGFIVGPFGLITFANSTDSFLRHVTIGDPDSVSMLAEFGIVFLMFMIGLELSPRRLWDMRRMVFGLGFLQVVLSSCVIIAISMFLFHKNLAASVVIGTCMALSSTAIVMQLLTDRHLIAMTVGRACFSILLFQDIAVVPILILIGLLGAGASGGVGITILLALAKGGAAIVALLLAGHFLLRPLFRLAGSASGAEPFMAITLLTVIVASMITGQAGLSMALGAFLGGLLLAETEYRHAIEVYIEPFKGLLLGLFFMTVGMGIDPSIIRIDAVWIALSVIGLIVVKAGIIAILGRLFGLSTSTAIETGLLLGQAGEFAFVIIGTAVGTRIISEAFGQFLMVVTGMSMIATPFVAVLARKLVARLEESGPVTVHEDTPEALPEMHNHVLIAGFGRVGRSVAAILEAENIPYLALDTNTHVITEQRKAGQPIIYGDASREDLLKHCHLGHARAVLVTMGDTQHSQKIIESIRHYWPDLPVFTRARDLQAAKRLNKAGSTVVVAETIEASLQLASSLLRGIGSKEDMVLRRLELSREYAMNRINEPV